MPSQLTIEDAKWIKEYYDTQVHGRTLRGVVMEGYYEAERILNGWDEVQKRDCTCKWRNVAFSVHALRDRYSTEINKLYDEYKQTLQPKTTTKRGRKKTSVEKG